MTSVHSVPHADLASDVLNKIEIFFLLSTSQAVLLLAAKPSQTLIKAFLIAFLSFLSLLFKS